MQKSLIILCLVFILLIPQQPAAAQTPGPVYVVQAGDTLYLIAIKFGISVDDLIAANTLVDPNMLAPGDELVIPGYEGVQGRLVTQTIDLGETLRSLSIRHGITQEQVIRLNRLTSPSEAFAGASLIVPDPGDAAQPEGRYLMPEDQSLFALAVANNLNPWAVSEVNQFGSSWEVLPGEAIYAAPGSGSETDPPVESISLVSPLVQNLTVEPLPLVQGYTTTIQITAPNLIELSGELAGYPLRFFPNGENQWASLQGVHVMADPGLVPLVLHGKSADGQSFSFEQTVILRSGGYIYEDINGVDPATIDPAVTQPENDIVNDVVAAVTETKYWDGPFLVPGYDPNWITSWFGNRRSYNGSGYSYFHTGLDYGGGTGLEIKSPAAGVIVFAGPLTVRGNATIIDHGWGVYSGFWHQSEIKVEVGDRVEPGQVIGLVGGTGRVTGAHLHWEIWVNGVQVDPLTWLETTYP